MCAIVIVRAPRDGGHPISCSLLTKTKSSESPVMTSGMTRGAAIRPENRSLPENFPMCVKAKPAQVPKSVATVALTKAMRMLRSVASIICSLLKSSMYQRNENPFHTLIILESLKE